MPDAERRSERATTSRSADHAGIERLADELLPALIAKLATTHLGELEVREGDWHVRLRRPAASVASHDRRSTDRPSRTQPGHEGHGHPRGAVEGARPARLAGVGPGTPDPAVAPTNGTGNPRSGHPPREDAPVRQIATSPAVGVFHPGARATSGTRVRTGDSLGAVDVLGVRQEVVSPVDGIVGLTLVEGGTAVEYGQELVRIEVVTATEAR